MTQIYYSYTGKPYIVIDAEDLKYLPKKVTQTPPPNGIYSPYIFDETNNKWVGGTVEEYKNNSQKDEESNELPIDEKDIVISTLLQQNLGQQTKIDNVEKDVAALMENLVSNGGTPNV